MDNAPKITEYEFYFKDQLFEFLKDDFGEYLINFKSSKDIFNAEFTATYFVGDTKIDTMRYTIPVIKKLDKTAKAINNNTMYDLFPIIPKDSVTFTYNSFGNKVINITDWQLAEGTKLYSIEYAHDNGHHNCMGQAEKAPVKPCAITTYGHGKIKINVVDSYGNHLQTRYAVD